MDTKSPKIVKAAQAAKTMGYLYIYSIVKSKYRTTYYHVVPIDQIIEAGRWIPAPVVQGMPWHGRWGQRNLPEKAISRSEAYLLVK